MSLGLRVGVLLVPAVSAAAIAVILGHLVPPPDGPARLAWACWLFVVATLVATAVERAARRLLPLAVLLQLSLVFPDRAPSRFALARTAGNTRRLEERIGHAKEHGVDDDPARAARQILELVAALSAHDRKTRGHSERVRAYTDMLATELDTSASTIAIASGGPRSCTTSASSGSRPGSSTRPVSPTGTNGTGSSSTRSKARTIAAPLLPWLGAWAAAIAQHHERFDGCGYPAGLAGGEISLAARVVAVADSFEVMTASRAYKRPMSVPAARRELTRCGGAQFDPEIVRLFLNISIGRLWWTVGPASWIAVTPVMGWFLRTGTQVAAAAKGAAVVTILGIGGSLQSAPTVLAAPPPAAPSTPVSTVGASPTDAGVGEDTGGRDDHVDDDADPTPHGDGGPDGGGGGGAGSGGGTDGGGTDDGGTDDGGTDGGGSEPPGRGGGLEGTVDAVGDTLDDVTDVVDEVTGGVTAPVTEPIDEVVGSVTDAVGSVLGGLGHPLGL